MDSKDGAIESRRTCSPDESLCRRSHLLPLLLLFILLFVIYFNSFSGTWVFDDRGNIVENHNVYLTNLDWESVKGTFYGIEGSEKISRPLSYLSFGINYYVHELDVFGYHLVNFIIHSTAALFLYLFIFQVLHLPIMGGRFDDRAGSIALLAAVLWAAAPIQVTSVTYLVQRMTSMAGMFVIMSMYFYMMGRIATGMQKKLTWFSLCLLTGLLALASKENAAILPIVLYMFDLLLIQGVTRDNLKRHLLLGVIPLVVIVALAFILTNPLAIFSGYDIREFTLIERLLTQPRVLLFYLSLMIYPMTDRFTLVYDIPFSTSLLSPWTTLPAILFWAAWTAAGIYWATRRPLISFCLLFFVVTHIIESSILPLELVFEHRNYLPSMTLYLLAGVGIIYFIKNFTEKRLLVILCGIILCITIAGQGYTVVQRNELFGHPLLVWSDNVEKSPRLTRPHLYLGIKYSEMGMYDKARDSLFAAIKADRHHRLSHKVLPFLHLGNNYLRMGEPVMAKDMYEKALNIESGFVAAGLGLTKTLIILGEINVAKEILEANMNVARGRELFHKLYSLVLLMQGQQHRAMEEAKIVLNINPAPSVAHKLLGEAHKQLCEYQAALTYWQYYAEAYPDDLETLLAQVELAHLIKDHNILRHSAIQLLALKGDQSWDELFQKMKIRNERGNLLVLSTNPWSMLPLIKMGIEMELGT